MCEVGFGLLLICHGDASSNLLPLRRLAAGRLVSAKRGSPHNDTVVPNVRIVDWNIWPLPSAPSGRRPGTAGALWAIQCRHLAASENVFSRLADLSVREQRAIYGSVEEEHVAKMEATLTPQANG